MSRLLEVDDVTDLDSLVLYAHQRAGVPLPLAKEDTAVKKKVKEYFEQFPDATYSSLTDVVRWMKARGKHLGIVQLLGSWRYAHQDGFMKILEQGSTNDDISLSELLQLVDDPATESRMKLATSASDRNRIFKMYTEREDGEIAHVETESTPYLSSLNLYVGQVIQYQVSPTDSFQYGTILGEDDPHLIVHHTGSPRHILPRLVKVKYGGDWLRLNERDTMIGDEDEH